MNPAAIRDELREGRSLALRRRRRLALLAAVGAADFAVISLYQLGVIRRLPDLPGRIFDSNKVNAAPSAYRFALPDGPLGLASYAAILALAGVGGSERTGRRRVFDVLLGAVVGGGVIAAAGYLYDMIRNQQRACPYCLTGAALNFAMIPSTTRLLRAARAASR